MFSVPKAPDQVQKDTINLRRSSRVSKQPGREYLDLVSLLMSYGLTDHTLCTKIKCLPLMISIV